MENFCLFERIVKDKTGKKDCCKINATFKQWKHMEICKTKRKKITAK
jgi:hypothetical protein